MLLHAGLALASLVSASEVPSNQSTTSFKQEVVVGNLMDVKTTNLYVECKIIERKT